MLIFNLREITGVFLCYTTSAEEKGTSYQALNQLATLFNESETNQYTTGDGFTIGQGDIFAIAKISTGEAKKKDIPQRMLACYMLDKDYKLFEHDYGRFIGNTIELRPDDIKTLVEKTKDDLKHFVEQHTTITTDSGMYVYIPIKANDSNDSSIASRAIEMAVHLNRKNEKGEKYDFFYNPVSDDVLKVPHKIFGPASSIADEDQKKIAIQKGYRQVAPIPQFNDTASILEAFYYKGYCSQSVLELVQHRGMEL